MMGDKDTRWTSVLEIFRLTYWNRGVEVHEGPPRGLVPTGADRRVVDTRDERLVRFPPFTKVTEKITR